MQTQTPAPGPAPTPVPGPAPAPASAARPAVIYKLTPLLGSVGGLGNGSCQNVGAPQAQCAQPSLQFCRPTGSQPTEFERVQPPHPILPGREYVWYAPDGMCEIPNFSSALGAPKPPPLSAPCCPPEYVTLAQQYNWKC